MSKRDWKLFVFDILECIEKIEDFTSGMTQEEFVRDIKTRDAVLRNFEIIGEAAGKIPADIRGKYNGIPWSQIIGLRNRLIHGYFVVDYNIIWEIVRNELPDLKVKMKKIIEDL